MTIIKIIKLFLNLIFPIILLAGKCTWKPINSCIRTWFEISPQLTKKTQEWVYSYQSRILLLSLNIFYSFLLCLSRRATRGGEDGGRGGGIPALFRKLKKSALIWRKNVLIVVIYGYNFSIKMKFLRVSRGKTRRFFPCGAFLSRVVGECLSKCPNSKKTPLP